VYGEDDCAASACAIAPHRRSQALKPETAKGVAGCFEGGRHEFWKLFLVRRILAKWSKIIRSPLSSSRIFCAAVAIAGLFCIPAKPEIGQKCLSRRSEKQTPMPRRR
jgi:hypothetical protein